MFIAKVARKYICALQDVTFRGHMNIVLQMKMVG